MISHDLQKARALFGNVPFRGWRPRLNSKTFVQKARHFRSVGNSLCSRRDALRAAQGDNRKASRGCRCLGGPIKDVGETVMKVKGLQNHKGRQRFPIQCQTAKARATRTPVAVPFNSSLLYAAMLHLFSLPIMPDLQMSASFQLSQQNCHI